MMHERLIEAVRNRSVLYDTSDADYMRSKLKDEIWNKIANDLNLKDGTEAKQAWLKLRNCHRDALRRQHKILKSGAPAIAIRKWKFQKQMEFLVPYMANRPRGSNVDENVSDNEESQEQEGYTETQNVEYESENEVEIETVEIVNENARMENSELSEGDADKAAEVDTPTKSPCLLSTPSFTQKNKKIKRNDISSLLKESLQRHEKRAQERAVERKMLEQQRAPDDHLYHFFMSMYEITKKLPPASQHNVRNNVFQTVSQAEADFLNIPHPSSQRSYFQSSRTEHPPSQHPRHQYNHSQPPYNQFIYNNSPTSVSTPQSSHPSTAASSPLLTYCDSDNIDGNYPSTSSTSSNNTLTNFINNFSG